MIWAPLSASRNRAPAMGSNRPNTAAAGRPVANTTTAPASAAAQHGGTGTGTGRAVRPQQGAVKVGGDEPGAMLHGWRT